MKLKLLRSAAFFLVLILISLAARPTLAQTPDPTSAPPSGTARPLVLIDSYYTDVDTITPGQDFNVYLTLTNHGSDNAVNIIVTFATGDLIPRQTGGTVVVSQLIPGESKVIKQPLAVNPSIYGGTISNAVVSIAYDDQGNGASFTASFNVALHINYPAYHAVSPTPTATPLPVLRPQLTIAAYNTDIDPLQPGLPFKLSVEIQNLGNADAKGVSMILGGGTGSAGSVSGTPEPGGVSGASGEFTNFAPLKSSNVHFIGDVTQGQTVSVDQTLIVNTTTNPGAYSVKFSFAYVDIRGNRFTDDQVITLLVYQLPLVDVTFYRDPGPFFTGQLGALPIQITNLSRKATILGNMKATVKSGGQVTNNVTLIGAMDPGGYFTLDATLIPEQAGPIDVDITVNYTDDFNQPKTFQQTLPITVQEQIISPETGPNGSGSPVPGGKPGEYTPPGESAVSAPETFMEKVVRFAKGLIGLDSGKPQSAQPGEQINPSEGPSSPIPGGKPIIIPQPPLKGG